MNIKKAVLFGLILWMLIFVEVSIEMFAIASESTQQIVHVIVLPILVVICSILYFKKEKKSAAEGLLLGVIFLAVGTVLDLIITIPLFVKSFSTFYGNFELWFGFVEVLVFCALIGAVDRIIKPAAAKPEKPVKKKRKVKMHIGRVGHKSASSASGTTGANAKKSTGFLGHRKLDISSALRGKSRR